MLTRMTMKRRDALKTIGQIGAAAGLARYLPGCGGGNDPGEINTYVFMMMENRSYDHMFGARSMIEGKPGNGPMRSMSNKDLAGNDIALFHPTREQLCDLDPPHGWDAGRLQLNGGKNDGFVTEHQKDHGPSAIEPMQYLVREDVPVSYALADKYAIADKWFCSLLGPTWPNRFYWHSGQSGGLKSNDLPTGGVTWPSIYHRLDAKGIDWRYYYGNLPLVSFFEGLDVSSHLFRFRAFLDDAAAGTLPPVVYIDPAFNSNDDHPPVHPINGQQLIAAVYKALRDSPQWKNILFVVTYDECGGFFDHVAPGKTVDERAADGFDQLGFRVPAMVMGPYVKQGYISPMTYEHCSALRHLEKVFDLEPLNQRTAQATDLDDFIDQDRLRNGDADPGIDLPEVNPMDWPMGEICMSGSLTSKHDIIDYADRHPEMFAGLDLRHETADYRATIRDFLAQPTPARVK